jgi:hypothetical protein
MLVGLAKGLMPDWTTVGETGDFGTLLLELFAYSGDVNNYYVDRIASEAYLGTAIRRQSVMYIADMFGYIPIGQRSATVPLSFTWTWNEDNLPGGTVPSYSYNVRSASIVNGLVTLVIYNGDTGSKVNVSKDQTITVSAVGNAYDGVFTVDTVDSPSNTTDLTITYRCLSTVTDTLASIPSAAKVTTGTIVKIPSGTFITTSSDTNDNVVVFELNYDVVLDTTNAKAVSDKTPRIKSISKLAAASEGVTITPTLAGVSKGVPNAEFVLANPGVIDRTVQVYTKENSQVVQWSNIDKLSLASPTQSVFTTYVDDNNYTHVLFGDNACGRVPPTNVEIYVSYRYGVGKAANALAVNTVTVLNNDFATQSGITVTNTSSPAGGADIESTDSIRYSVPRSASLKQRAITIEDYVNLALQVPGITKAIAYGANYSTVYVRIASTSESTGYVTSTVGIKYVSGGYATVSISDALNLSIGQSVYTEGLGGTDLTGSKILTKVFYEGTPISITRKSLTSNLACVFVKAIGTLAIGQPITVSGLDSGTTVFDGTHIITSIVTPDDLTPTLKQVTSATSVTLTTGTTAHGLAVGDTVTISLNAFTSLSGTYTVATVPSTTTFTYAITGGTTDSSAVTLSGTNTVTPYGYCIKFSKTNDNVVYTSVPANSGFVKAVPGVSYATTSTNVAETIVTGGTVKSTNPDMQSLINSLESYLTDKKMIGSVVYGEPVEWTEVDVNVGVAVRPLYNRESVRSAVQSAIETLFSYDNVGFGQRISIGDVYRAALSVEGVDYVNLNSLHPNTYAVTANVSSKQVTSATSVTLTTAAAHGLSVGERVTVYLNAFTSLSGTYTVATVPSTTTFTYAITGGTVDSAAVTLTGTNTASRFSVVDIDTDSAGSAYAYKLPRINTAITLPWVTVTSGGLANT